MKGGFFISTKNGKVFFSDARESGRDINIPTIETTITIKEIKELLQGFGIKPPTSFKKPALLELLIESSKRGAFPEEVPKKTKPKPRQRVKGTRI